MGAKPLASLLRNRRLSLFVIPFALMVAGSAPALAAPGDLDRAFSTNGLAPLAGADPVGLVATTTGGVIVGHSRGGAPILLEALTADGSPDIQFGQGGQVEFSAGPNSVLRSISTDAEGRIMLAGLVTGDVHHGFVARLNPDGSPDSGFGQGGVVLDPGAISLAYAAESDQLGRLVVVGQSGPDLVVTRLLATGAPDTSFGTNSATAVELDSFDFVGAAAVADSSIYAGSAGLIRLTEAGVLDSSFAGDGIFEGRSGPYGALESIVPLADGRIALALNECVRIGPAAGCQGRDVVLSAAGSVEADKGLGANPRLALSGLALLGSSTLAADELPPTAVVTSLSPSLARNKGYGLAGRAAVFSASQPTEAVDLAVADDATYLLLTAKRKGMVARLLGSGDVHDRDADGVADDADRCPWGFAERRSGCSEGTIRLTAHPHAGLVRVRLASPIATCIDEARVRLLAKRSSATRSVATKTAHGFQADRVRFRVAPGRYLASVRSRSTALAKCDAASTPMVTVRQ